MIKEIGLGGGIASIVFLFFLGYNLTPLLLVGGLVAFFYLIVTKKTIGTTSYRTNLVNNINFDSIGGQAVAIKELKEGIDFINKAEEISRLGIRPLKGILLTGPPGTGKTLLAKAAANYTNSAFLAASGSEFIEMYAGVGAQRIRKIFQQAKELAKSEGKNSSIIFIDEIDVLGTKRGSHMGHMEYDQTLNQLLVEMDGLKTSEETKILLIAATNRPDMLDPALLRPGRFDRQVKVDLPDKDGRLQILTIHAQGKPLGADVNLKEIARETFGLSGAHLENLLNEAAILAMRLGKNHLSQNDILEAIDKVIVGEKSERKPSLNEMERISIHETGHALVSEWVKPGSVANLTVTPRGNALGYMRQSPGEDTYLYTLAMLENQIKVCLGGTVAEQVILGNKSTGSANDFQQAVDLTKKIIFCGLSSLGVVSKDDLGPVKINKTVDQIITRLESEVTDYLQGLTGEIMTIKEILLDEEAITGEMLRKTIKGKVNDKGMAI